MQSTNDVIVIGSGASGGMAAWNLTRQGVDVLMLDAGEKFSRSKFWTHVKPWEWNARVDKGDRPPQFYLDTKEQPYDTPQGQPFDLVRVWGRGGKTNVWGRVSLRYSDVDFAGPEKDGWEIPWPIRYKDIQPYYDKVDQFIGVCGGNDDQDSLPGSPYMLPAAAPRCGERLIQRAAKSIGVSIVAGRRAVLTQAHNGHAKCHFCGSCGRGCDVGAFFNSSDYLIEPAMSTGKLRVMDNAVVARVLVNDEGKANGVQYFDRITGEEHTLKARVVIVAASCIDSTRILLNSKSSAHPNGIGNSSDVIGRYLSEQIRFHMYGFLPELIGGPTQNDDGIGGEHVYMPRFNHRGAKRDYLRGFGSQFWGSGAQADAGFAKALPGFGVDFKTAVKKRYPALVALHPYGEVLPRAENRVTVDESHKDRYGVPVSRITYKIGDNEHKMAKEMYDTAESILKAAKAEIVPFQRGHLDVAGSAIHEHGTCRMGTDPKKSALNGFCQMHEVPNVFVVDGAAFTTASEKNPTLTILALTWRATDYLAQEMKERTRLKPLVLALVLLAASASAADRWVDYRIGPFHIISNAGDKAAREKLNQIEQFRWVLGTQLGKVGMGKTGLDTMWPIDIVLFSNQREYLAHAPGKPFLEGGSATLSAWSADTAFPHEWLKALARLLIDDNAARMPDALETALCDLFSTIQVTNTHVKLGAPLSASELPPDRMRLWAKMQMLATLPDYSGKLRVYLNNIQQTGDEGVAVRNAFDLTAAKLDALLDAYIKAGKYEAAPVNGEPLDPTRDFPEKPVEKAFVDGLFAELAAGGKNFPPDSPRGLVEKNTHASLELAIKANPRWAEPHAKLAAISTNSIEKMKELKTAATLDPHNAGYWQALAEAQAAADQYEDAAKSWSLAEHAAANEAERAKIHIAKMALDAARADFSEAEKKRRAEEAARDLERVKAAAAAEVHAAEAAARERMNAGKGSYQKPIEWFDEPGGQKVEGKLTRVDCLGTQLRLTIQKDGGALAKVMVRDLNKLTVNGATEAKFGCGMARPVRKIRLTHDAKADAKLGTLGDVLVVEFP